MDLVGLLSAKNLMFASTILVVVSGLKFMFADFAASHWGARLLPVLPMVLGVAGSFSGWVDGATVGVKVFQGFLAGMAAAMAFKVGKTTLLGQGVPDKTDSEVPTPPMR